MDPVRLTRVQGKNVGSSIDMRSSGKRGKSKKRKTKEKDKDKDILVKMKIPEETIVDAPETKADASETKETKADASETEVNASDLNVDALTEPTPLKEKTMLVKIKNPDETKIDASTDTTKEKEKTILMKIKIPEDAKVDASTDTKFDAKTNAASVTVGTSTKEDVGINTDRQMTVNGDEPSKQRAMLADVRAGLQKAYLDGIEFIRLKVKETEEELDQIKMEFYQSDATDDDQYQRYVIKCNEQFLQANNELRRKNVKLKVVDGEMQIVAMLNLLREHCDVDKGEIGFISELWENMKTSMERLKILVDKFRSNIMDRLHGNCLSYNNADIQLEVSIRYTEEISQYLADIEKGLNNTQILLKSFANGVHQDLFQHTKFTEKILVSCDLKAFPILRLFPDLTEKIELLCATALKWLDRDERYMYEINDFIKETRSMTKRRADDLKAQKNKMKKFEKSVKAANILLHNNKEKLQRLEGDLNQLESTMDMYKQKLELKNGEKNQKESMVDFLKLTLSQTKKNYNLQLKRQRLLRQVQELEEFLQTLERDLNSVQDKILEKAQLKDMLAEKVGDSEKTAGMLRTDLERFTDNLNHLETEVNSLSGQLLQLEIIQTFKSSPENIDGVYDRPQSVKLAPSLKEKIKQRKRKLLAPVH